MTATVTTFQRNFGQRLWYGLFRLFGWKAVYQDPGIDKYVIIVAPHTSNFDFFIGFIFSRAYPLPSPHFFAKSSVFKGVIGRIMRKVGGIPVDRSKSTGFVDQVAAEFRRNDHFVVAITPEGTRKKTRYWKSGFYHIARAAEVPVVMSTIDYSQKLISYGTVFHPTGDMEADIQEIRAYYGDAQGRHPERQGPIEFQPATPAPSQAEPAAPTAPASGV